MIWYSHVNTVRNLCSEELIGAHLRLHQIESHGCPTTIMAIINRAILSLVLLLSVSTFLFAHSSEAFKGPKITHQVRRITQVSTTDGVGLAHRRTSSRCILISNMEGSRWEGLLWACTERLCPR